MFLKVISWIAVCLLCAGILAYIVLLFLTFGAYWMKKDDKKKKCDRAGTVLLAASIPLVVFALICMESQQERAYYTSANYDVCAMVAELESKGIEVERTDSVRILGMGREWMTEMDVLRVQSDNFLNQTSYLYYKGKKLSANREEAVTTDIDFDSYLKGR